MSQPGNEPVPMIANRWGDLSHLEQLDTIWCVEIDVVRTPEGRRALKVKAYDFSEEALDIPGLRQPIPIAPPAMYPYDCPLPLWLAYSAVCQATEAFLRESTEFTLG